MAERKKINEIKGISTPYEVNSDDKLIVDAKIDGTYLTRSISTLDLVNGASDMYVKIKGDKTIEGTTKFSDAVEFSIGKIVGEDAGRRMVVSSGENGSSLSLNKIGSGTDSGTFKLTASFESDDGQIGFASLLGNAKTGELKWNGRNVETVESTKSNGVEWCRVYSDGWCEQGGKATADSGSNEVDVELVRKIKEPVFVTVTNICSGTQGEGPSASWSYAGIYDGKIKLLGSAGSNSCFWEAKGFLDSSVAANVDNEHGAGEDPAETVMGEAQ